MDTKQKLIEHSAQMSWYKFWITLVFDLQVIDFKWLSLCLYTVYIQTCILKDLHLIIEIIKSCNNLILKSFSVYGLGARYEGHKGHTIRPQRIPNMSDRLPACCHWKILLFNWSSQAILFTKYKNKMVVLFYRCICLCISFSLDWKQQPNCTLIVKTQ